MSIDTLFNNTFSLLEKNMDLRIQRHQLIVSNIANMNTPNYKAFDIAVQDAFSRSESREKGVVLQISSPLHIGAKSLPGSNAVQGNADLHAAYIKEEKNNDIDKAMMNLAENSISFNAAAQILSKKYNLLKQTIHEKG